MAPYSPYYRMRMLKRFQRQRSARSSRVAAARSSRRVMRTRLRGTSVREQVHTFIKAVSTTTIVTGNGALAIEPQLTQLAGATDIGNLYDQYRFMNIKVTVIPHQNSGEGLAAPTGTIGYLYYVQDQDGGGPATDAAFKERPDLVIKRTDRPLVFNCRNPRISSAAYAGGAFTGYTIPDKAMWIDCDSNTVPHYGMYFLFSTNLAGMTFDIITQVTLQAKHSR